MRAWLSFEAMQDQAQGRGWLLEPDQLEGRPGGYPPGLQVMRQGDPVDPPVMRASADILWLTSYVVLCRRPEDES
jgi:hypothetical protein